MIIVNICCGYSLIIPGAVAWLVEMPLGMQAVPRLIPESGTVLGHILSL